MSGIGRGRGGYGDRLQPMRRPGEPPQPRAPENIVVLVEKIKSLNINNVDPVVQNAIETIFTKISIDKQTLKDTLHVLHKTSLSSIDFSQKYSLCCKALMGLEIDGCSVRSLFLQHLQSDYKNINELRSSNINTFVNAVAFTGFVFYNVKVSGQPIGVLGKALLEYLNLLLLGDEVEFEIFTTQIFLNGRVLKALFESEFEKLEIFMRTTLITRNLSTQSRVWILLAIDFTSNDLNVVTGALRSFYIDNIGERDIVDLEEICATGVSNTVDIEPAKNVLKQLEQKITAPEPITRIEDVTDVSKLRERMKKKGLLDGKKFSNLQDSSDQPKGMSDYQRRNQDGGKAVEEKGRRKPTEKWRSDDHDDRCEKDAEFYGKQNPREPKNKQNYKRVDSVKAAERGSPSSTPLPDEDSWD